MIELTSENTADYLRRHGWVGSGAVHVEPLGWGVSNVVLRVATPQQIFVLKQSRPQLRTRDAWFSDLDRVYREQEVMQVLARLLPPMTVPELLFSDRENYVFAMSHAPNDARVWKEMLLAGEVDQAVASRAGHILGLIHQATGQDPQLVEAFRDHTVFVQLRVDPFYGRIQERWPDLAKLIEPIAQQLLTRKEALCHGDYSPKNILVHAEGFTLVDYETAHFGDPTMDLGFFLSHIILKAIKNDAIREQYYDLTRSFWSSYSEEVRFASLNDLVRRGIAHFAVCALARIDGTSPVDYLDEGPKRNTIRRLCRELLEERTADWDVVLDRCEACQRERINGVG
jgi:5-methylthioribose kinase